MPLLSLNRCFWEKKSLAPKMDFWVIFEEEIIDRLVARIRGNNM